jgi:hypothetical protein
MSGTDVRLYYSYEQDQNYGKTSRYLEHNELNDADDHVHRRRYLRTWVYRCTPIIFDKNTLAMIREIHI